MPVYEYEGKHYDLSTADPAEAKSKIMSHLGKDKKSGSSTDETPQAKTKQRDLALLKSAAENVLPAGGAALGATIGTGLGALTGPAAPFAMPVLGLAGGYLGEKAGEMGKKGAGEVIPAEVKEAMGFSPEQRKREEQKFPIASKIGEYAPTIAGLTPAIKPTYELAKAGASKLGDYLGTKFKSLVNVPAQKAEQAGKSLLGQLPTTAEKAAGEISSREAESAAAEYAKRTRQETNLKTAEQKFLTEADKERQAAAAKYAGLGKPNDPSELGSEMQRQLVGTEARLGTRASQQAARDYGEYFEQAKGFETSAPRAEALARLKAMSESGEAGSAGRSAASKALKDLSESPNAVGAEKEFRKYFEGASGPIQPGYGQVEQQASQRVSDIIGEALNKHAPKRIQARETYKEYKTPQDAFETLFGKAGVKEESAVAGRTQMLPSAYPDKYFKNKDTLGVLREQLRGDEAAVRKFANQHAVNELQGKNAEQAASWLQKNKSWVDDVPGLNKRVNEYVNDLARSESAAALKTQQAGKLGKTKGKVIEQGQQREAQIAKEAQAQRTALEDDVRNLNLVKPEDSSRNAKKMLDRLQGLKDANGKPIVDAAELQKLRMQIQMVDDAYQASDKAKKLRTAIIVKGLGALGVGGLGTYGISRYLSE